MNGFGCEAFGLAERPTLARMLAADQPERMVAGVMATAEDGMRAHLKEEAEKEAVQQREQARLRPGRGMGMGM